MPFAYYDRLSAAPQARSTAKATRIEALALPPGVVPGPDVVAPFAPRCAADDRTEAQRRCQRIVDALTCGLSRAADSRARAGAAPDRRLRRAARPLRARRGRGTPARISVWMRTARKRQVVAFKSFLRTLCHELCHHLDYELFALEETFHTEGFYKRESSLANALLAQRRRHSAPTGAARRHRRRRALCYNRCSAPRGALQPGQSGPGSRRGIRRIPHLQPRSLNRDFSAANGWSRRPEHPQPVAR